MIDNAAQAIARAIELAFIAPPPPVTRWIDVPREAIHPLCQRMLSAIWDGHLVTAIDVRRLSPGLDVWRLTFSLIPHKNPFGAYREETL